MIIHHSPMDSETSSSAYPSNTPTKAWGVAPLSKSPPCSLRDVMSEELVTQIEKEETDGSGFIMSKTDSDFLQMPGPEDTSNDLMLALMLQHEFDTEHDDMLRRVEDKFNNSSTVKLSFEKYRAVHPSVGAEDVISDMSEEEEDTSCDVSKPKFKRGGIIGSGRNIISKHDSTMCSRRNAEKFMENLPPEFDGGDEQSLDMRLPNKVYNKLKTHMQTAAKRSQRIHEKKEHSTMEHAVDAVTRLILYKLVNGGLLESVEGIISSGKESVVFHATGATGEEAVEKGVPNECAIKVFKTTLADFRNRSIYMKGDTRFFKDEFKKQNPRKVMKLWAEKEERNLHSLQRHGVNCPKVVVRKKHVLAMSFIGHNGTAAPKLLNAQLSVVDLQMAYEQCVEGMRKMYHKCNLVHADLSAYNMLWHNEMLYFIDVSQAVDKMHPHAHEFLLRDCNNVCRFFTTAGVPEVPSPFELFNQITGLDLAGDGKHFLMQIEEYEKDENKLRLGQSTKDDFFNFFFELSNVQRKSSQTAAEASETKACSAGAEGLASPEQEDATCGSDEEQLDDDDSALSESTESEDADESSNTA